ncbi:MAG: hypothetical protein PHD97_07310 [Bacteroidales bacterium]|nr:hypothetical protein [Bacteroidales bacterium]
MTKRLYILIILSIFTKGYSFSQQPTVNAKLEKSTITIGDQIKLNIQIKAPENYIITFPVVGDTIIKNIDVIGKSKIDTVLSADKKTKTLTQSLYITSFDSGYFAIPPFEFTVNLKNDTTKKKLLTEAMLFQVKTIPVDTTKAIKDIKPPFEAPLTFREMLPYILSVMGGIIIIILIIYVIIKIKRKEPILKFMKPKLPPHEIALMELNKLRESKLWQQNMVKLYYIKLSDIIRIYIEGRFEVIAMEMTTDEILKCFETIEINTETKNKLKQILALSDFVKFAKLHPLPNENDISLNNAFGFVNETKPLPEQNENIETKTS